MSLTRVVSTLQIYIYNYSRVLTRIEDISDALQNIILQHANINTFIKHHLPRRSANVRAIISGLEPQKDLMRAASRIT
jgi:hypothetical protein